MQQQEVLEKYIKTAPDTIQFAKDRKYEEAWIINKVDSHPTQQDIVTYLDDEYETLIVEYMWNSDDTDNVFVLTVFNDKDHDLVSDKAFIETTLQLFYKYKDFPSFISEYDRKIVGKPYLFRQPIEEVNISIFNHWLSVGPESLYLPSSEVYSKELVREKLNNRPDLLKTELNFPALLFRMNFSADVSGPAYGFKPPVSTYEKGSWAIDVERLLFWIETFI